MPATLNLHLTTRRTTTSRECQTCSSRYIVVTHRESGGCRATGVRDAAGRDERPPEHPGGVMDMEKDDTVGGYSVPVDPMDLLQCDSCQ